MKHTTRFFLAVTAAAIFIVNAAMAAENESIRPRDRETINYITSINIKMPKGAVYRRGESLPIVVEIQNKSSYSLPFRAINGMKRFRLTAANGTVIGTGNLWNHISPWEYLDGFLAPTQTISDTFYFERLQYRVRGNFPTQINIQFEAPIQEAKWEGKTKYTFGVPIELRDQPFEYTLVSDDLPESWTPDMDIFFQEAGGFAYRYSAIHIEGSGRVTTIRSGIADANFPIKKGRNEFICPVDELNGILGQLRNFKIEKLNAYDSDRQVADGITISISISKAGSVFCGNYPVANGDVWQLRQILLCLINNDFINEN